MSKLFIGVDLGGTKIYTALSDENGNIIKEIIKPTEASKGYEQIVEKIKESIRYVSSDIENNKIISIGIGSPGPLDVSNGLIVNPPNLPFNNFNIVDCLKDEFKLPVFLDNDANAATLAEYKFGAGVGTTNMIFITASTGVGAGAVLNKNIYRGSTSNALELGHTTVDYSGNKCGCGNMGCVEAMSSGTAIKNQAEELLKLDVETSLRKYDLVTAKEVFIESSNGDKLASEVLRKSLGYLGVAVSNAANIFDPDMIVVGGGVSDGGQIVFDIINEEMKTRCLSPILKHCIVKKAQLGGKAGVLGAVALAMIESKNI
ncbi:ROK family protein [Clostridium sp.]|uniref:ROK family protein n=1 Tax=Clostridium sp. TaxID=1506 RepID=UPI0025C00C8B|nr:ROK family protein [Clostridium sp.]MCI9303232.1 ROK family protein [Clostridium sp.]